MKVSFDLHGVIDDMPDVMKFIMSAIIDKGGEVHIITGSTTERARQELKSLGFVLNTHYTHLIGLPDFLHSRDKQIIRINQKFGNPEFSDLDWNSAKAQYCSENKINLHFDDTLEYGKYFRTPFCRLWTKDK